MGAEATDPKPLRADARRNREAILDAARITFAEDGSAAQIDDIARRAGVGVGTVYRHFPTKDALAGALMERKFRSIAARMRRWSADVEDPWEAFCGFVRESAELMAADRGEQTLLWVATEPALAIAGDAYRELREASETLVRRAQEAGALRADFTTQDMPMIMCGIGSVMHANDLVVPDWRRLVTLLLDGARAR